MAANNNTWREINMIFLEIIEFRSSCTDCKKLKSLIYDLIDEIGKEANKMGLTAYSHISVDTDFSIHLHHDAKMMMREGSELGLRLVATLKEFGLVNHSIWIEMSGR
jgi:hypothetical protein